MTIEKEIFRAYDIRGIVNKQLNEETVYLIGQAIGTEVLAQGSQTIITARDGRLSGPQLIAALHKGILATGCHVIDIGMTPTPVLYFATHTLGSTSGVVLTGSHNPPEYNGLKVVINGQSLSSEAVLQLYYRIKYNRIYQGRGRLTTIDVSQAYLDYICQNNQLSRKIKVVIDCGNGATGILAPQLFKKLGCEVTSLYDTVDGHFPNHHPDPSIAINLQDLIQTVKAQKADIGLAFDGDGDRLGVVTNAGEIIWADRQLALFARDILTKHPGSTIVYDVKCSKHLTAIIKQSGGKPLMYKTGHSLLKNKMLEVGAVLSGEMSGHLYFKDRWFGFDDGMYTGVRLLEILANQTLTSDALFRTIPDSINTPELKIAIAEKDKFNFITMLINKAVFPDAEINTIDGLRVDFTDGWGLIRCSNTTAHLTLRFEADNDQAMIRIQRQFRDLLLGLDAKLVLPF